MKPHELDEKETPFGVRKRLLVPYIENGRKKLRIEYSFEMKDGAEVPPEIKELGK